MKCLRLLVVVPLVMGCSGGSPDAVFKLLDSDKTHIDFVNTIEETEKDNVLNYEYFYNGGGVAAADFNNDGLIDLYFTANQGTDKLYINEGELLFKDVTEAAGIRWNGEWKTGVTVVDINKDGWQDIYVSVSGNVDNPSLRRNKLYINNKNLTFTDRAAEYGLDLNTFTTQTAFFDYDKDDDLDAYILNHNVKDFNRFDVQAVHAMRDSLAGDRLMRNDNGKFTDVSVPAGIKGNPIGFGLGIHTADLNNDGWPDIYISNDYIENDYLYINNGDGTFTDQIGQMMNHGSYFSMGNDVGDINNDLLPDVVTADMLPEDNKRQKLLFGPDRYEAYLSMLRNGFQPESMRNMLQLNNGDGTFSEVGQLAGISNTDWSWSVLLADYDNDGYQDLFVTNGYLRDYTNMDFMKYYADEGERSSGSVLEVINRMPSSKVPNYIFRNEQNLTFSNKQADWGFDQPVISNGAVYADLDGDGDLEIITNNINEKAHLYQNLSVEEGKGNYLSVVLDPTSALASAVGTKVYVYSGNLRQSREYTPTHGYQSSLMIPLHFGLGSKQQVDSLVVVWPDGRAQTIPNVKANQRLQVDYSANLPVRSIKESQTDPLFVATNILDYEHRQIPFNDFNRQFLLPHMYSYQGPRMATGDANGDGLEDVYIGGGKGQAGQLLIQKAAGKFIAREQPEFKQDELRTDTDAIFFDADKDGDLDLYVTSGGFEYLPNDLMLQNRLYRNDGRGNFTRDYDALPEENFADSSVEAVDFDRDGDLDLFIGGTVVPTRYPEFNPSRLYRNDGGKFVRVSSPVLDELGLVTDACVLDFDQDGYDDLVVVGEWMPIVRLRNNRGIFERVSDELDGLTGFWQRVISDDFDRDGDADLIVGNYGLNVQWKATPGQPLNLIAADFDGNGKIDPIMSYYIQGQNYPTYSRDELSDQLVGLKKVYTSHELYSTATIDDVLKALSATSSKRQEISTLATVYLINNGKGAFERRELPVQAQFAPVYALLSIDVNQDGYQDIILAGNQSRGRVRTGNIDANFGQVLLNDRKGGFSYTSQQQAGLKLRGDVRDIKQLGSQVIIGINSQKAQMYQLVRQPLQ